MDRTIARAVTDKKPVPEIDFTLHVMEDGTQVSTMERVIKGNATMSFSLSAFPLLNYLHERSPNHSLVFQRCKRRR